MRCVMSRHLLRALFLSLALAATAPAFAAEPATPKTGQEILAEADRVRNPGQPFRVQNTLVEYRDGQPQDKLVLNIFSKESATTHQFRNLARYVSPARDNGKLFLMDGKVMWFYDPASSASIRISPQQRLLGQASNGDVLTVNLARDYSAQLLGEEKIQDANRKDVECWRLELTQATEGAVYSKIDYWIEKATFLAVKGRFYSDSGRLLKIIYYTNYQPALGGMRASEALILDEVDRSVVTKMSFSDYRAAEIPESWFQRDYLPRLPSE